MHDYLEIRPPVAAALAQERAVVALESTVIAHGLPPPRNLETAREMEAIIEAAGAVPATVALIEGRAVVGLEAEELARLAEGAADKVSRRNIASVLAGGGLGATTVAATMVIAHAAGIRLLATGGIGGVHRGHAGDVSADLVELTRSHVAVVCSGNKIVLDIARSFEYLETLGVPVIGYQTDRLPAFYVADSGIPLDQWVADAKQAAALMRMLDALPEAGGCVIVNPPPPELTMNARELERIIDTAIRTAAERGVRGKDVTPFLLERLAEATGGRSIEVNIGLLQANARAAAEIAVAYAATQHGTAP